MVAGEMDRGGGGPVVGAVGGEQLRAPRVYACHAGCVLDRLRASVGEHHVVQPGRGELGDQLRRLTAHVVHPDRAEGAETVGLFLDRGDDSGMLVAHVREHELRAEVEVAPSGVIDEVAAFAADESRDVPRRLRYPGVKDQLIELGDLRHGAKTISPPHELGTGR